ncbi:hypothetical protein C6W10_26560 [Plantactinospora sp. BB1]|nr:hypothetical protein C6W10_26560 [Plantactinospora sp. BB1]
MAHRRKVAYPVVAALVLVLFSGACDSHRDDALELPQASSTPAGGDPNDARIVVPGSFTGAGKIFHDTTPDTAYDASTNGVASVCLDRPGRVTVTEIRPEMSTGEFRVEGFALAPVDGSASGTSIPLSHGSTVLERSTACVADPAGKSPAEARAALLLRVRMVGPDSAAAEKLILHYTSGDHRYEFSMPWRITLCAPGDDQTRGCRELG